MSGSRARTQRRINEIQELKSLLVLSAVAVQEMQTKIESLQTENARLKAFELTIKRGMGYD